MLRVISILRAEDAGKAPDRPIPFDAAVLAHDERHLRRKALRLGGGESVLVDLPEPVQLRGGDLLVLEDGRHAAIEAASEELHEIVPRDALHLAELCWHIGNRHLAAAIRPDRILILRDQVIRAMLEGLGATVRDVAGPFEPLRGAYSGHGHSHGQDQRSHSHGQDQKSHSHGHVQESHSHGHSHHHEHGHVHRHD